MTDGAALSRSPSAEAATVVAEEVVNQEVADGTAEGAGVDSFASDASVTASADGCIRWPTGELPIAGVAEVQLSAAITPLSSEDINAVVSADRGVDGAAAVTELPLSEAAGSSVRGAVADGTLSVAEPSRLANAVGRYAEGTTYTERYADGSEYVGSFRNNNREGGGRLVYTNGDEYVGQFFEDRRHGWGRMSYAHGDVYEGHFVHDKSDGHGSFVSCEGWSYIGQFSGGEIRGEGSFSYAVLFTKMEKAVEDDITSSSDTPGASAVGRRISAKTLAPATRRCGRHVGTFEGGLPSGWGRVEFETAACGTAQEVEGITREEPAAEGRTVESDVSAPGALEAVSPMTASGSARAAVPLPAAALERVDAVKSAKPLLTPAGKDLVGNFCEGYWESGHRNGFCVAQLDRRMRFEGEWIDDEASGRGHLVRLLANGDRDTYWGSFADGLAHGRGVFLGPRGTSYHGEFAEGLRHGNGKLNVRGTFYAGEFRYGLRHGSGRYRTATLVYDGEYQNDERNGRGRLRERLPHSVHDFVYEGQFVCSLRHGMGRLRSPGQEYRGWWCRSLRHGYGCHTSMVDGDIYEGNWEADRWHGFGKLSTTSIAYEGDFVCGEQEGSGKQTWTTTGDFYKGEFSRSMPHGNGAYTFQSRGESYTGFVESGLFSGDGTYVYADGATYVGQWRNGKQNGKGQLRYADERMYTGEFKDDMFDGDGAFRERDGTTRVGTFEANKRIGEMKVFAPDGSIEMQRFNEDGEITAQKTLALGQGNFARAGGDWTLADGPELWKQLLRAGVPKLAAA
eukprot:TRINITY_DN37461_c0_g1_i1.p1 TRINITY_DN37461_c0_g1~~TRINITY_DN37461_c0_g1_i1.p1  ORF type:complete len:823 (+),score=113.61 TRINITY_DN37461_c0_g1_i1:92-2470(+)